MFSCTDCRRTEKEEEAEFQQFVKASLEAQEKRERSKEKYFGGWYQTDKNLNDSRNNRLKHVIFYTILGLFLTVLLILISKTQL